MYFKLKKFNDVMSKQEYILCAAIKRIKHIEVAAHNYQTNNQQSDDIYSIEIGRRHNNIMSRFGKTCLDTTKQGFYTSWGRFVSREEALQIAKSAGQVSETISETKLFSEDLY